MALSCVIGAKAQLTVSLGGGGPNPDPAYIVVGEYVDFEDTGSGASAIFFNNGQSVFPVPAMLTFNSPGDYSYYDDVGDVGTVSVAVNIPPSVPITNPATNAVLIAPATFDFSADASDTDADGMSDVQFFVGTNLVDDVFSVPYTTTITNLPTGNYTLTAIAFDLGGASATNSIQIAVVNPTPISLRGANVGGGQFSFLALGLIPGKTNVLQFSTNLSSRANWTSIATNVAAGSSMAFTNPVATPRGYFRLQQFP